MKYFNLVVLIIYAIDRDLLSLSASRVVNLFLKDGERCKATYTNSADKLLYVPKVEAMTPVEFFTDYVLYYARMQVISGLCSYGKYDKVIMNYENN